MEIALHYKSTLVQRLGALTITAAVAVSTAVAAAAPANAATPRCNAVHWLHYYDYNGDAGLRSKYPTAGAFNYYVWPPVWLSPVGDPTPACQAASGARGEWVKDLQTDLNVCYSKFTPPGDFLGRVNLGFAPLAVDGVYGAKTKAAVTAVQRHIKIKIDGSYGPQTALAMKHTAMPLDGPNTNVRFCHTIFP
ncbi:peptidoglycan-binding domain-containing protein [Catellatospora sp. NPDC049111]|uniref:peptidoglycan-binding domain-containing protein n=1 Tax=Catellatospora sp. NPDC049111 TaxID=3155271 RepID=UPI003405BD00